MDDAVRVGVLQRPGYVAGDPEGAPHRQAPLAATELRERAAGDVAHHEVGPPALHPRIADADDPRVTHPAEHLGLATEANDVVAGEPAPERLDRDGALGRRITGEVDDAHGAFAEHANDLVAPDPGRPGAGRGRPAVFCAAWITPLRGIRSAERWRATMVHGVGRLLPDDDDRRTARVATRRPWLDGPESTRLAVSIGTSKGDVMRDQIKDDAPVSGITVGELAGLIEDPTVREVKAFLKTRTSEEDLYLGLSDGFAILSYDGAPRAKGAEKVRISPGYGYEEGLVTFIAPDGDYKVKVPMSRICIWAK